LAKKVAEAKKKVEAMAKKQSSNPYLVELNCFPCLAVSMLTCEIFYDPQNASQTAKAKETSLRLDQGIHPLLADMGGEASPTVTTRTSKDRYKSMMPKFTTLQVCSNLYLPAGVLIIVSSHSASLLF
jgi:hypothetical protein